MKAARLTLLALVGLTVGLIGCAPSYSARAAAGIVYYCPGAGNIDFGDAGVRSGLQGAGFQGEVASYSWTISLNPAIDQTIRANARIRAAILARLIEKYIDQYPGKPVHLVGLSAGTGIALWAIEDLKPNYTVDNVVLLSSSLRYDYDISRALPHIRGKIYNYYSSNDAILAGPMKIFGTIDGEFGVDGAGAVGLRPPRGADRVVNTRWTQEFAKYGYHGGHTDSTAAPFIRAQVAPNLVTSASKGATTVGEVDASPLAKAPPAAVHR